MAAQFGPGRTREQIEIFSGKEDTDMAEIIGVWQ